jgi:hypothetical protein
MSTSSDHAELSTIRTLLDDLTTRVVAIADRYGASPDSAVAADLYAAERSLIAARRSVERASAALESPGA